MKTQKLLLTIFLITIILFNINTYTFATESIEESEEITEEGNIETLSDDTEDSENNDIIEELPSTDFLSTSDGITNVSTVNSISQMNLQLNNILCIILISIGVLLILFAIAILIRLKQ